MTKRLIEDSSLLAHKLSKIVFNGPGFLLHFTLYEFQGMSDRRSFDRRLRSRSFFRDRDRDRRSPFDQKIAGRSRSRNSTIAIAKMRSF